MADLSIILSPAGTDLLLANGDLQSDAGLAAAVALSLFTDRRADNSDSVDNLEDLRGWWADALNGRAIGSRLWLLSREKTLPAVVQRAQEYIREALSWLVNEGVASAVDVAVTLDAASGSSEKSLIILVAVLREKREPLRYRYAFAWGGFGYALH